MSPIGIGLLTFACLFAGALFGMRLRNALPDHHVSEDSRHLLQTGLGIIGTMAGLILGLLVASATNSYNAQRGEVLDAASKVVLLDRVLAHYGPETDAPRPSPNGRASAESDLAPKGLERSSFNAEYWSRVLLDEIGGSRPTARFRKHSSPKRWDWS